MNTRKLLMLGAAGFAAWWLYKKYAAPAPTLVPRFNVGPARPPATTFPLIVN